MAKWNYLTYRDGVLKMVRQGKERVIRYSFFLVGYQFINCAEGIYFLVTLSTFFFLMSVQAVLVFHELPTLKFPAFSSKFDVSFFIPSEVLVATRGPSVDVLYGGYEKHKILISNYWFEARKPTYFCAILHRTLSFALSHTLPSHKPKGCALLKSMWVFVLHFNFSYAFHIYWAILLAYWHYDALARFPVFIRSDCNLGTRCLALAHLLSWAATRLCQRDSCFTRTEKLVFHREHLPTMSFQTVILERYFNRGMSWKRDIRWWKNW